MSNSDIKDDRFIPVMQLGETKQHIDSQQQNIQIETKANQLPIG